MVQVAQVYDALVAVAPLELAAKWDNVGLLVDAGVPVHKVLVTLDITHAVVEEAKSLGCELIVSHHPVIFSPLKTLSQADVPFKLVQAGISAICMHTNLDAAVGGVNDALAAIFELKESTVFADGCGRIGTITPTTSRALASLCEEKLCTTVKFADAGKEITRLALVSGAGGSYFAQAAALGADCLLTGEANHHQALDAVQLGLSLVAAGHYATEICIVPVLAQRLQCAFPLLQVYCSDASVDPFTYL